jgi:hypothetical protein
MPASRVAEATISTFTWKTRSRGPMLKCKRLGDESPSLALFKLFTRDLEFQVAPLAGQLT